MLLRKTSGVIKIDLEVKGIKVSSLTVRRRLLDIGRKARKPVKKQLLINSMTKQRYQWGLKYKNWTQEQ